MPKQSLNNSPSLLQEKLSIVELRYRRLFETAQDGILLIDFNTGLILDVNQFLIDLLGYTKEDFLKKYFWNVEFFKDTVLSKKNFKLLEDKGYIHFEDVPIESKIGDLIDVEVIATVYDVSEMKIIQCSIRDITKQKKYEIELLNEKAILESIFESIPGMVYVYDEQGNFIKANKRHVEMTGYSMEELSHMNPLSWYDNEKDIVKVKSAIKDVFTKGYSEVDVPMKIKNGTKPFMHFTGSKLVMDGKNYFVGVGIDITASKQAEDELHQNLEKYVALFQNTSAANSMYEVVLDKLGNPCDYRYVEVNRAFEKLVGMKSSELIGKTLLEIFPKTEKYWLDVFEEAYLTHKQIYFENFSRELNAFTELNVYTPISGYLALSSFDITARKNAEQLIIEGKNKLKLLFDNMTEGIININGKGKSDSINPAAMSLLGITEEQFLGRTPIDLGLISKHEDGTIFPFEKQPGIVAFRTGRKASGTIFLEFPSGDHRAIYVNATPYNIKNNGSIERNVLVTFNDITEQRKKETALELLNKQLNVAQSVSGVGSWTHNLATNTVEWSHEMFNIFGIDPKNGVPTLSEFLKIIHPEERIIVSNAINAQLTKNQDYSLEFSITCPNGTNRLVHMQSKLISKKEDKKSLFVGIAQDITDQKLIEESIKLSELRYRRLFETAQDGILILDAITGQIVDVNPYLEKLLGYKQSEFLKKNIWNVGTFKNIVRSKEAFKNLQTKGYIRYEDLPVQTKDGRVIQVEFISNGYLVDNLKVIQCNIRNITDRVNAEKALVSKAIKLKEISDSEILTKRALLNVMEDLANASNQLELEKNKAEAILSNIGEGLIVTDTDKRIIITNDAAAQIMELPKKNLIGKKTTEFPMVDADGKELPVDSRPISQMFSTGKLIKDDYVFVRKDKTKLPVSLTVTPLKSAGKIIGSIIIFHDVSREKAIDRAKSEFVSLASHQLRTPLGISKWYLEVLETTDYLKNAPDNIKKHFAEVYKSNEHVISLVRNLLSVSRIEQGKIVDAPKCTDLPLLISEIIEQMQIMAHKKKVSLSVVFKVQQIPHVTMDALRFREVFENLITNALEYTLELGVVTVEVNIVNDMILISVHDNGIGISVAEQKLLFTKFFRSENATRKNPEGSGLGLYVVKSYVENWGGHVSVESFVGKGSTFTISLPISKIASLYKVD